MIIHDPTAGPFLQPALPFRRFDELLGDEIGGALGIAFDRRIAGRFAVGLALRKLEEQR